MKTIFFTLSTLIISSFTLLNTSNKTNTALHTSYANFDSTMVVHLYHGGGMHYSSQNVFIRYDSCVRVDMLQGHDTRKAFAMNDVMRKKVLDALNINHFTGIKHDDSRGFAHDKATTSICVELKGQKNFCASSSASGEIAENSKVNFSKVWDVLVEFSLNKGEDKK